MSGSAAHGIDPSEIRFVVITKNSARWFDISLNAYAAAGVRPFVMLDASSDDGTEALLQRRNVEYVKEYAEFPRVEALIGLISKHVDSRWVVRLDDDELPCHGLYSWIASRLDRLSFDAVGFQRRAVRMTADGTCEYSRHPLIVSKLGVLDAQWRMFKPGSVQYRSNIHTPGFFVPKGSPIAPGKAYIAHFNWLVRTSCERRHQIDDYDRQETNAGSRFRDIKVWEDGNVADHQFRRMETDEFDATAVALAATVRA
jgi:hypothetical protein